VKSSDHDRAYRAFLSAALGGSELTASRCTRLASL